MKITFLFLAVAAAACGGTKPAVPAVPPVTAACKMGDSKLPAPGSTTQESSAEGPHLGRLLPGANPVVTGLTPQKLLAMERAPADAQWKALPPEADAALIAVVDDAQAPLPQRVRAMSGLAVRQAPAAVDPLKAALADRAADPLLRRGAARALAAGWPDAGRDALVAALADPDAATREAVVKALAPQAGQPAVRDALKARLEKEDAPLVREAIQHALQSP